MADYIKLADTPKSLEFQMKMLDDDKHWRDRADEVRAVASNLTDLKCREIMMRIAQSYDDMAIQAIRRQRQKIRRGFNGG